MKITADSGSTKTTWLLTDNDGASTTITTQGINPFHQSMEDIRDIIYHELVSLDGFPNTDQVAEIYFYGAGCTKELSPRLATLLHDFFHKATTVEVGSDLLGAAKALFGNEEGIACILGTGANSCFYDGEKIVANVSPMGYILGDEGSGAFLGKTFINLLYKGKHDAEKDAFEKHFGITQADIIEHVYRKPMPNRFLASFAPYIKSISDTPWVKEMLIDSFRLFFRRNVAHYDRAAYPCSFVGSIAHSFEDELREAAKKEGFHVGKIMKAPIES